MSAELTPEAVRRVTAHDLGYDSPSLTVALDAAPELQYEKTNIEMTPLEQHDGMLLLVRDLLTDHGGVIFLGPSGTGKSYYARRIALTLSGGKLDRCRFIQFHPSYQYEDFMEGFRPLKDGQGFTLRERHFVELSRQASADAVSTYVIVIDELSRGDPGRVFGEALTYLERSKRGMPFQLASGTELIIPSNLVILATMNPLDHGASDVDAALDRRFAKVGMDPDAAQLKHFLISAGMDGALISKVVDFFNHVNSQANRNPYMSLGQTYFIGIKTVTELNRLWDCQLQFHFDKAFPFDKDALSSIQSRWKNIVGTDLD